MRVTDVSHLFFRRVFSRKRKALSLGETAPVTAGDDVYFSPSEQKLSLREEWALVEEQFNHLRACQKELLEGGERGARAHENLPPIVLTHPELQEFLDALILREAILDAQYEALSLRLKTRNRLLQKSKAPV